MTRGSSRRDGRRKVGIQILDGRQADPRGRGRRGSSLYGSSPRPPKYPGVLPFPGVNAILPAVNLGAAKRSCTMHQNRFETPRVKLLFLYLVLAVLAGTGPILAHSRTTVSVGVAFGGYFPAPVYGFGGYYYPAYYPGGAY